MKQEIRKCPICEKVLFYGNTKLADVNGICFAVGYSTGGWGRRQNHVEFSDEVCIECYGLLVIHAERFLAVYESRKGCNHEELQVVRKLANTEKPVKPQCCKELGFIDRFLQYLNELLGKKGRNG